MVEVLVKPWNEYTIYYRDPKTRQFKPLKSEEGDRYQVRFSVNRDEIFPLWMERFSIRPSDGSNYDRMFSRKKVNQSWILKSQD